MFFMKKYFSAENVFIFQIFLCVTLFFISIVFFFLTQYPYDFPKLDLILCFENMLKFLGPFQKYIRSDGGERGGTPNICENLKREGVFQEYTYANIFLKEYFLT